MRNKNFILYGAVMMLLMISCNSNKTKENTDNSTTQNNSQTTSTNETAAKSNINVTITGGDMAGTYSAVCTTGCCSWGIAGENVFGNQYSETGKGPKELSSVQLIVDDVTGNKSTNEFTLTVSFGELFSKDSKSFNIDTRKGNKQGSGTLDLQYSGDKATVSIKGVSKEGPSIDLQMQCDKVMNSKNIGQ